MKTRVSVDGLRNINQDNGRQVKVKASGDYFVSMNTYTHLLNFIIVQVSYHLYTMEILDSDCSNK